jgi:hypothetical protein
MRDFDEPLDEQISFRAWVWLRRDVQKIATGLMRDESEIGRFLLARGLAAYERDQQLIEPEPKRGGKKKKELA